MKKASDKNLEDLTDPANIFVNKNGRQYLCLMEEVKEASDAREQALPMEQALCSMQEKMDQNSKETSTTVSNILKKIERVDKELAAAKSENLTSEMLQIDVIDDMRDDIRELKEDVRVLVRDLRMDMQHTSDLKHEIWVVKDDVKNVTKNFEEFKEIKDLEGESLENEMLEVKDEISEVRDEMCEVKDSLKDLGKRGSDELPMDVKAALKGLKDGLKDVTNELKGVKYVSTNLGKEVMSELRDVKEELTVVRDTTGGASDGQNEIVHVQDFMLREMGKMTEEVSCVKHDVRLELANIRYEMQAAKDAQRELKDADTDLLKEFNDIVRGAQRDDHGQHGKPTLDDLRNTFREVMTKLIINKKRKRDSREYSSDSDLSASAEASDSDLG